MPSALKKLGSRFFIYLVTFVLIFSFIVLFVLGLQTKELRDNISDSFKEFSNEVNEVSEKTMSESADTFIENYVDMETKAFSYFVKQLKTDISYLADNLASMYEDYEEDKSYYMGVIKNYKPQGRLIISSPSNLSREIRTKVFYQVGTDRNDENVKKSLGILYDYDENLQLSITDSLQARNCYVLTESGVSIFETLYDFENSPKYSGEEIDFKNEDWYQRTLATTSVVFNSAYRDVLSNKDIISVEKAIIVNGKAEGVIVIEIYVDSLNASNINLDPPEGVNLFISDSNGKIIYNARSKYYDESIAKEGTLESFLAESRNHLSGRGSYIYNGNEYRCFYKAVKDTNFTLYVSVRENRLLESVNKLKKLVDDKNDSLLGLVFSLSRNMYIFVLLIVVIGIAILSYVARRISKMLEAPIHELSGVLEQASKIQQDMLPQEFSKISNRRDIEIYAKNDPESEVGGDFYDYIIRNNKLYLMIADVSGSGMPAALFMAKTNTLLKAAIKQSESPRVILSYVNSELCKNNKECYFVTIALYCIDLKTRKVVYSNSGHEDSIIIKNNNEIILKNEVRSAPLGLDEHSYYNEEEFELDEGDILFLYTDGVIEAINKDKELFGMDRLKNELKALGAIDTKSIVLDIEKKVNEFAVGLEQYDDITMLCFKFKKLELDESKILRKEKTFSAVYENVEEVDKLVEECLKEAYEDDSIYKKYISQFNVCIEEIVVNICDYAYPTKNDANNCFTIKVLVDKNVDKIAISFIDSGAPFDPTARRDVNILQGVNERHIGGFGIHITKNIVDIMEYERENDKNIFVITKFL